jgi:hypothetical protein
LIQVVIGHFHRPDVEHQLVAREQSFRTIKVAIAYERQRRVAKLILERALGLLRNLERELECVRVIAAVASISTR